jgi:hypothetical protein
MKKAVFVFLGIGEVFLFNCSVADSSTLEVVSDNSNPPSTADGIHILEGTDTVSPKTWHARQSLIYLYNFALADRASQFRISQNFGIGLPCRFELDLFFPVGFTIGSKAPSGIDPGSRSLQGMSDEGVGLGDLEIHLLFSALRSPEKGFGLLLGISGGIPTGDNEKLMGEGGFFFESLISFAFQIFGSRLGINVAYRVRPEHVEYVNSQRFEQDDVLKWRVGIRVPRKNDAAWSIQIEGMIGFMTAEGGRPSRDSRPFRFGGGLDFPISRLHRLGLNAMFGPVGETVPSFSLAVDLIWRPVLPDEDKDSVTGAADKCPLLKEDFDGYQDRDGCPDLDNDKDGFPDDEDSCPLVPAGNFSDDGCP